MLLPPRRAANKQESFEEEEPMTYKDIEQRKRHDREYSRMYYCLERERILEYKRERYWSTTREDRQSYQRGYYNRNRETINATRRLFNDPAATMQVLIYIEGIGRSGKAMSYECRPGIRAALISSLGFDPEILLHRRQRANYLPCSRSHGLPGMNPSSPYRDNPQRSMR